jgi:hypothetical protein
MASAKEGWAWEELASSPPTLQQGGFTPRSPSSLCGPALRAAPTSLDPALSFWALHKVPYKFCEGRQP